MAPSVGKRLAATLVLLALAVPGADTAGADAIDRLDLEAVLIERFTRFVTWPDGRARSPGPEPFRICVVGDTPQRKALESVFRTRTILDRTVQVLRADGPGTLPECEILYLAAGLDHELEILLADARETGTLTIAGTPGFGRRGVMINMVPLNGKLGFEINETAFVGAGFAMSYHLLKKAKILDPVGGRT